LRIWDRVEPNKLCRQHLLGEHREIHGLWRVLERGGGGYWHHPETQRWIGHRSWLKARHDALAMEMRVRGYRHMSPLPDVDLEVGPYAEFSQPEPLDDQISALRAKGCSCSVRDA
jgi:hypothetical protein